MARFSSGHISATPFTLKSAATLEELKSALSGAPYSIERRDGFGAISDPTTFIKRYGPERPTPGSPAILDEREPAPRRLASRFYFDELDKRGLASDDDASDVAHRLVLEASDLLLASEGDGEYLGLVGLNPSTGAMRRRFIPALELALEEAGLSGSVFTADSSLHLETEDLFKWLIYRWKENEDLGRVTLTGFDVLHSSEAAGSRRARLAGGAEMDRPELLALVAGATTRFGPAKLGIKSSGLDLIAQIELRLDGGFTLISSESRYLKPTGKTIEQDLLNIVEDIAYDVIPAIKDAYAQDLPKWSEARPEFTNEARRDLISALAGEIEGDRCPVCEHSF